VINALLLKTASGMIRGFDVDGFWYAIFGSLIISAISWLLNSFVNERGSVSYHRVDPATRYSNRARPETRLPEKNDTIDLENKGDDRWE
jgi:hypothetical protein